MKQLLTPRQVAQSLGVSESSLKRWCDRGVVPSERTAGGHRRIPLHGVMQFLRDQDLQVVRPEILGLPPKTGRTERSCERSAKLLYKALVAGDAEAARRIVFDVFLAGESMARIGDQLIVPVLAQIGEGWECGDVEIYQEHLAVEILFRLIHELRFTLPASTKGARAIGGTVEGDVYGLPTRLVELVLLEQGWNATSLGTSLPWKALLNAARRHRPRLLWISASVIQDELLFIEGLNRLRDELPGVELVLGGQAVSHQISRQLNDVRILGGLQQLDAVG